METYQMKTLLEIATEKLKLLHLIPVREESVLGQLMLALVDPDYEEELYREVLALSEKTDHQVCWMMYLDNPETLADLIKNLKMAMTKEEIRDVLIDDLLMSAHLESWRPEPD